MSQESLNFGRLYSVKDAARTIYRALNDAADVVGVLPAAGACGIDRSDLRRALDRDGRRVAVEHAMSIGAIADTDTARRIASSFAEALGFSVIDQIPKLSDKERADRLEGALRALGPLGAHAMTEALGGRR